MGKVSEKYKFLKNIDKEKKYLFKSGIFYIFLNEDAEFIAKKYNFKITPFGNDTKCGFPVNAQDKYLNMLKDEEIEIISEENINEQTNNIIKILNKIDLDNISPKKALEVLYELKGIIK